MKSREEQVREALQAAIKAANNNQSELARRMTNWPKNLRSTPYKQQHINHWLSVGNVPAQHAPAISWAVGGAVHPSQLCPGVFDDLKAKVA